MPKPLTKFGERFEQAWRERGFKNRSDFIRAAIKVAPERDKPNNPTVDRWIRGNAAATRRKVKPFADVLGRDVDEFLAWLHEGTGPEADVEAAFTEIEATQQERIDTRKLSSASPGRLEIIGIVKALRWARAQGAGRDAAVDRVADEIDERNARAARGESADDE